MTKIRITKEFVFDMAHALYNYVGACKNIHGHTYKLQVTLIGSIIKDNNNAKNGMVIDFGDLKKIVKNEIIDVYDHALVVNSANNLKDSLFSCQEEGKFIELPFQPTAENLIAYFAEIINSKLQTPGVKLHSVRLWETPTSCAEWTAEDNV